MNLNVIEESLVMSKENANAVVNLFDRLAEEKNLLSIEFESEEDYVEEWELHWSRYNSLEELIQSEINCRNAFESEQDIADWVYDNIGNYIFKLADDFWVMYN